MSRNIGWTERHAITPTDLRRLADILDSLQEDKPLLGTRWTVDVVAPEPVWDRYVGDYASRRREETP